MADENVKPEAAEKSKAAAKKSKLIGECSWCSREMATVEFCQRCGFSAPK